MQRRTLQHGWLGGIPLLFVLYFLQGLPFGLVTGSLPLLLSGSNTADTNINSGELGSVSSSSSSDGNYRGAAYLSVAALPYGLKLLWAPYVDTVYIRCIGRRLSWIYPCNFLACLLWLELSTCIDGLVEQSMPRDQSKFGSNSGLEWRLEPGSSLVDQSINNPLMQLAGRLLIIVWVMAISDVAVDGWALTVRRNHLARAALAQTLGMTSGNFVTNVGLLCGRTPSCYSAKLPWSIINPSETARTEPVSYGSFALLAAVLHCAVSVVIVITTVESSKEAASDDDDNDEESDCRGKDRFGNVSGRKRHQEYHSCSIAVDNESGDREMHDAELSFNKSSQSVHIAASSSISSSSSISRRTLGGKDPTAAQLLTALRALGSTRHACTLGFLLMFGRIAFALVESGTLPAVEFVRAGGQLSSLACVTALQLPMQALLSLVVVRRLTPSSSSSLPTTTSSQHSSGGVTSFASASNTPSSSEFNASLVVWRQAHVVLLGLAMLTPLVTALVATLVAPSCSNFSRWAGTVVLGALLCVTSTFNKCFFVAQGAYFNGLAEAAGIGGGTTITLLNSLSNCGRFFPRPLAFWLTEQIGVKYACSFLALLGCLQWPTVKKWLQVLQHVEAAQWQLSLATAGSSSSSSSGGRSDSKDAIILPFTTTLVKESCAADFPVAAKNR